MERKICSNCQFSNDPSAMFCSNCGNSLPNKPPEEENIIIENNNSSPEANISDTKPCPHCGEDIKAIAKKCKHCGSWLEEKVEKPQIKKQIECPTCAELVDEDISTCPYCKQPIKTKSKRSFLDDEDGEMPDFKIPNMSKYFNFTNPGRIIIGITGAILLFVSRYVPIYKLSEQCLYPPMFQNSLPPAPPLYLSYSLNGLSANGDHFASFIGWFIIILSFLTIIICFREKYNKMFVPFIGSIVCIGLIIIKWSLLYFALASGKIILNTEAAGMSQLINGHINERLTFVFPDWGMLIVLLAVALIFIAKFSALSKLVSAFIPAKSIASFFKDLVK